MPDVICNIAKGAAAEKVRDTAQKTLMLLLAAAEADAALIDHDTLALLLAAAGNTEFADASYARKAPGVDMAETLTVDDINDRVDLDLPDQIFTALAGGTIVAVVLAYEETAADTGRVPIGKYDFAEIATGSDVQVIVNAAGYARFS